MQKEIQVRDPANATRTEPITGLIQQTLFQVTDRQLVLLQIDDKSAWHYWNGSLYGWIRSGDGHIAYDTQRTTVTAGEFVQVPKETSHRYGSDREPLEILAVIDSGADAVQLDAPLSSEDALPKVVGPDELVPAVESPDLLRETPFPDADVLMMRVEAAGGAAAGWHHHGNNIYFGYAIDGPSETEYGPAGEQVARIEIGECFHVPPELIHRDTNPTPETHTGIIWLCGTEPWVVNVDGPA